MVAPRGARRHAVQLLHPPLPPSPPTHTSLIAPLTEERNSPSLSPLASAEPPPHVQRAANKLIGRTHVIRRCHQHGNSQATSPLCRPRQAPGRTHGPTDRQTDGQQDFRHTAFCVRLRCQRDTAFALTPARPPVLRNEQPSNERTNECATNSSACEPHFTVHSSLFTDEVVRPSQHSTVQHSAAQHSTAHTLSKGEFEIIEKFRSFVRSFVRCAAVPHSARR